ncbi:LacI family DNA-binding transcriptional regulator [Georgenia halophila]|uniref:LacI family DNA-binding transcriptional regulator n=1 Tax=Georgenia halophila TaxID=620889 RepID=A0ABP8KTH3_9MICO
MATIDDVARSAGVSVSTVSYVLSGKRPISEPTRERVRKAVAELGYRPHAGARALASSRTQVIGLVAPLRAGVDVNVIMQFVAGVVTRARSFEHDVLLLTQDDVAGIERVSSGSMVDALVVMDVEAQDPRITTLLAVKQPVVLIGLPARPHGLSCVDLDFEAVGRLAVTHLVELGHRTIGLVGPPPSVLARHTSYAERLIRGLQSQAEEDGVHAVVEPAEPGHRGGQAATEVLLAVDGLTGIVVHNEAALPAVLDTIRQAGRRVPEDVAVLTVGPPEVALSQTPPVTSIDIPAQEIGGAAVDMVIERLASAGSPQTRLFSPRVTLGETTARH